MSVRQFIASGMTATCLLLAGCHPRKPAAAVPPPLAPAAVAPVMVSVPPPTHRSEPTSLLDADADSIPVMKPVKPPKKVVRRTPVPAPAAPMPTQVASVPAAAPMPALGQLTAGGDHASTSRDQSAQALRTQRERFAGLPQSVQAAHAPEMEQVRRFLKAGLESWNAADYTGALALATKAKVLLDDVLK